MRINKKGKGEVAFLLAIALVAAIFFILSSNQDPQPIPQDNSSTIKIANWNLQIFGDSKVDLIPFYVSKIQTYDIIFIQEIRDADGSSFITLCNSLPGYSCEISSRAGRSSSKEQYGVIYKKTISLSLIDYNPDSLDRWERPPIKVDALNFTIYNIHTKPDDVKNELSNLEEIVPKEVGNILIIGDLNADCKYYNPEEEPEFDSWTWVIPDTADTTVGNTDCAYDRIISNNPLKIKSYGIDTTITSEQSDHYLIWVEVYK